MNRNTVANLTLGPLEEPVQRSEVVYNALLESIIRGELESGAQLNADSVAQTLKVSTTPVRDALNCLEKDGLVVKLPYQGWFVRQFQDQEIRDLYEMRSGLECFSVGLACARITTEEIAWLREHQTAGEASLERGDMEAYRLYNQELHAAIMRAARNSELAVATEHVSRKMQMLSARTIRLAGRPSYAVREHRQLIGLIEQRHAEAAKDLMERHILSAMEDIFRHGLR
ncbi:MAG: GntR family transcriptional regulator [Bryobacterales bacterium]|nr:GntR family transcriptional regulator [Bryobacterales bacterium]